MDWSLVLISQGIESQVDYRDGDGAWLVIVNQADEGRACEAIRAYERENASTWRQEVKWTGLIFDWRAALVWAVVVAFFFLSTELRPELAPSGMMDRAQLLQGQWWRAVTAMTLHSDIGHLALNASTGLLLLGLAMGCYGGGTGLLAALLAGACANAAAAFLRTEQFRSVGASGAVMGALGLLAVHSLAWERDQPPRQWFGRGILGGCLLLVLLGFDPSPRTDIGAHVGGFVAGCAIGALLSVGRRFTRAKWFQQAAGLVCAALLTVAWAAALRAFQTGT